MSLVFEHPYAQALAWALIHFVWQGAAIALAVVMIQRMGRFSASTRYMTGVVAMAAMLAAPVLTFARLASVPPAPAVTLAPIAMNTANASAPPLSALAANSPRRTTPARPTMLPTLILATWALGVLVLSLRLLGGWIVARRLARRALSPASDEIRALARRVAGRLALDRVVDVFESSAVSVPMMIGWMKPVVLLPAAAMSGLSMVQVEALLAHELAHVRRHDYLVNLLQSVVETLLFYHPAVWFVSRRMRIEREHCCDDLAVDVCDRVVYATALSNLAAMARTPRVALAATDGSLLNRVRRILGQPEHREAGSGWLSACVVVLVIGAIAPAAMTTDAPVSEPQAPISSGVAGGVQSGVVGGVAGGVAGGVPQGVQGGVAKKVPIEPWVIVPAELPSKQSGTSEARAKQARTEEQIVREEQLRQLADERQKIEQERAENELRRSVVHSEAKMIELKEQMKQLQSEHARLTQQVTKGIASGSQLDEIRSKMALVENQIRTEQSDMDYQKVDMDLRLRALKIESEAARAKVASMYEKRAIEVEPELIVEVDKGFEPKRKVEAQKKLDLAAAELEIYMKMQEAKAEMATTELDASAAARAGNIVFVTIASEPDLPRSYVVQPDGTIRFPFLGAIRVQGLTARQVQESLSKQLNDRKLTTSSGITVTLRAGTAR